MSSLSAGPEHRTTEIDDAGGTRKGHICPFTTTWGARPWLQPLARLKRVSGRGWQLAVGLSLGGSRQFVGSTGTATGTGKFGNREMECGATAPYSLAQWQRGFAGLGFGFFFLFPSGNTPAICLLWLIANPVHKRQIRLGKFLFRGPSLQFFLNRPIMFYSSYFYIILLHLLLFININLTLYTLGMKTKKAKTLGVKIKKRKFQIKIVEKWMTWTKLLHTMTCMSHPHGT